MSIHKQYATAVLVFANSSKEEIKHKAIAKGNVLFSALTDHTLKTVKKSKLPYFHFSEKQQIGATFGERFINAIQAVFNKGYDQVITIGNDTPQLQASHIIKASNELRAKKFVLGASTDGGFYIMGIHKSQFNAAVFKKLAWQTSNLSKQIVRLIAISAVEIVQFKTLHDIDSLSDIKRLLARTHQIPKALLFVLLRIVTSKAPLPKQNYSFLSHLYYRTHYNKGSPIVFIS